MKEQTLTQVPVSDIFPSEKNKRIITDFDIKDLAQNIEKNGLLHPPTIRPHPDKDGKYEIASGNIRYLACQRLGMKEIPAFIRDLTEEEAQFIRISENFKRKGLTVFEEAEQIQELMGLGQSVADISANLGRPVVWVARRAKLLNLTENWKKTWAGKNSNCRGVVTVGALELVARLDKETQDKVFKAASLWQGLDAKGMAEALDNFMMTLSSAPWKLESEDFGPACSECQKRSGCQPDLFGKIEGEKAAPDKCLDRECFEKKQTAFLNCKVKQMREENPGTVLLKQNYTGKDASDLQKEAVQKYSVKVVTKKTPGAVPALQIDGPEAGKTFYIKPTKETEAKQAEKVGKSMKEKREGLEKRRSLALITRAKEYLQYGKSDMPLSSDDKMKLCAVFGSKQDPAEPFNLQQSLKRIQGKGVNRLDLLATGAMLYAADFLHNLTYQSAINRKDIETVCDLTGINYPGLLEKVEEEIPEPKSWAAEAKTKEIIHKKCGKRIEDCNCKDADVSVIPKTKAKK